METPTFINGFQNYIETFFQLTCMIQDNLNDNYANDKVTTVKITQSEGGHMALCELAKMWTEEFETTHKGEEWIEYDWFDTLEKYFEVKNASFVY